MHWFLKKQIHHLRHANIYYNNQILRLSHQYVKKDCTCRLELQCSNVSNSCSSYCGGWEQHMRTWSWWSIRVWMLDKFCTHCLHVRLACGLSTSHTQYTRLLHLSTLNLVLESPHKWSTISPNYRDCWTQMVSKFLSEESNLLKTSVFLMRIFGSNLTTHQPCF